MKRIIKYILKMLIIITILTIVDLCRCHSIALAFACSYIMALWND